MHTKSLQSCPTLCDPMDSPPSSLSRGFSRQEYWSGLPFPSPLELRSIKQQQDWNWAGPYWVLLGKKPFLAPYFLFAQKGFSLPYLPWVAKSRLKQLLIREVKECRNKGKAVKNISPNPFTSPDQVEDGNYMLRYQTGQKQRGWLLRLREHRSNTCYLTTDQSKENHAPVALPQILPLKTLPWKPLMSSGLLSRNHTYFLLSALQNAVLSFSTTQCDWIGFAVRHTHVWLGNVYCKKLKLYT